MPTSFPTTAFVWVTIPIPLSASIPAGNDRLRKPEFRYAVDKHAACLVERLEDRDGMAEAGQIADRSSTGSMSVSEIGIRSPLCFSLLTGQNQFKILYSLLLRW
jgi:hypothetical protein